VDKGLASTLKAGRGEGGPGPQLCLRHIRRCRPARVPGGHFPHADRGRV